VQVTSAADPPVEGAVGPRADAQEVVGGSRKTLRTNNRAQAHPPVSVGSFSWSLSPAIA